MKVGLDKKLRRYEIRKYLNENKSIIKKEEKLLTAVLNQDKKIVSAREFYASSKLQALVRGFLSRIITTKLQRALKAAKLIQRLIRGKLGRIRWKKIFWRSVSVVKSDTALKEIIDRSTVLREAIKPGRSKGYFWQELYDPLTESFWYYNDYTKQNTWQCPAMLQKDFICHWEGFYEFGGKPWIISSGPELDTIVSQQTVNDTNKISVLKTEKSKSVEISRCRSVFNTLEEYRNHLRLDHAWYCMACNQKNTGINFPKCFVCDNKYSKDGIDGEELLMKSIQKVRGQLDEFITKDVLDANTLQYRTRDRLITLAKQKKEKEYKEQMSFLTEVIEAANEEYQKYPKIHSKLNTKKEPMMGDKIIQQLSLTTESYEDKLNSLSLILPSIKANQSTLKQKREQKRKLESQLIANEHLSLPMFGLDEKNIRMEMDNDESMIKNSFGYDMKRDEKSSELANHKPVDKTYNQLKSLVSDRSYRSVKVAAEAKEFLNFGGMVGETERFAAPISKGVFNPKEFAFASGIVDDQDEDVVEELDDMSLLDDEQDNHVELKSNSMGIHVNTTSSSYDLASSSGVNDDNSELSNASIQKLLVCDQYQHGKCTLTTCPKAHPGIRDSAKILFKSKYNKKGKKVNVPYVMVCPSANGLVQNCKFGKACSRYHVYMRPSTMEIVRSLYPIVTGLKSKRYASGSHITGNLLENKFHGYCVMNWVNGATYMGDWSNNMRHGLGIHRSTDGTEYLGTYSDGKRHGWGQLSTALGEEYIGQWSHGRMEGIGILRSRNGDLYRGMFAKNLFHGVGTFTKYNGDQYMGHCREGFAHGLGIQALATGEKYKGFFDRNMRHGKGACAYANKSRYAGNWYRGAHDGYGVYVSPIGEKYIGLWAGGKKTGLGRYYFKNGDFYDGEFVNDKAEGKGAYFHSNGNYYVGQWKNDRRNGKGTYVFANGSRYTGHWLDNDIHHKGKFDFSTGCYYRGSFSHNRKHGFGIYTWLNGNIYKGYFNMDKMEGEGEMIYCMGHRYVGQWFDNKKHGLGTFYYASGPIYEGQFQYDDRHGKGKITFMKDSVVEESYEGDWVHEEWHGKGTYRYRLDEGTTYEGDWVKGVRHGKGTLSYKDGSYYRGSFVNDQMWGKGLYCGSDGSQYDGEWRANMRQGLGTTIYPDGTVYHGMFFANMKQGAGKLFRSDGSSFTGNWECNVVVGPGKETIVCNNKDKRDGLPKEVSLKVFGF